LNLRYNDPSGRLFGTSEIGLMVELIAAKLLWNANEKSRFFKNFNIGAAFSCEETSAAGFALHSGAIGIIGNASYIENQFQHLQYPI
jgi:hypothetical protein